MATKNKTTKPKINKELEYGDCLSDISQALWDLQQGIEDGEMSPNRIVEKIQYMIKDIDTVFDLTSED